MSFPAFGETETFTRNFNLVDRLQSWGVRTTVLASIGAGLITLCILVLMQALISEDFIPQDKTELAAFEINPMIVDIIPLIDRDPPQKLEPVEVPPAPPIIEVPVTGKPTESVTTGTHFVLPKPEINLEPMSGPTIVDREPQPIVRISPTMPRRADRSGHCLITFDISADGKPFYVVSRSCSQSLFERAAISAVGRWTYRPQIAEGQAVARRGMRTRITFQVTDDSGRIIPE